MKKSKSSSKRSAWLNGLLIAGTMAIVLILGAKNGDILPALDALATAQRPWLLCALCSSLIFILFETLTLHVFFRFQRVPIRFSTSLLTTLIGVFYSNVTPAATGGQPMQLVCLNKRHVPSGISASALTFKFFCFQAALLGLGAVMWALHPHLVQAHIGAERWLIYIGFAINALAVLGVLMLAINRRLVEKIAGALLKLLTRLRILRHPEKAQQKLDRLLSDFHASVSMIRRHPLQLLCLMLLSCMQVLGLMSVIYCVYRAVGLNAMPYASLLTLQLLLFIGAAFTPLPGSSGAQEGGFYLIFRTVFPGEKLLGALLLWRFFTYYLTLILGLTGVITDSVCTMRSKIRPIVSPPTSSKEVNLP